jgi:hypothetical protein
MTTEPQAVDVQLIKDMVRELVTTRPDEIDCPECFEHMDYFADLLVSGQDAALVMPKLQEHLERCVFCREEFEALLNAIRQLD